jgi:hypothetical protein
MRIITRTTLCACGNTIGLILIIVFIGLFGENVFEFGPSKNFSILHVKIDTWYKYIAIIAMSCINKMIDVVVNDIGSPNLGFTIYDPTKKIVYGFSRYQLQFLANWMWFINDVKSAVNILIVISRFDVALISIIASQITSIIVINYLLGLKTAFIPNRDYPSSIIEDSGTINND